jgi:hypothetical protein
MLARQFHFFLQKLYDLYCRSPPTGEHLHALISFVFCLLFNSLGILLPPPGYNISVCICVCVRVFLCLPASCRHDNLKNIKRINTKICATNVHCPRTNWFNFGNIWMRTGC